MQERDPYDLIAPLYDIEHAGFDDDLELYRGFATSTGGPLLELGCGSGRLLVPLARAGYTVTGVDRSAAMLDRCRVQIATLDTKVAARMTLIHSNMTQFALTERGFRCAFIALSTFNHVLDLAARRATLQLLRAHVVAGAMLVLDLAQQDLRRFALLAELAQVTHVGTWTDPASDHLLTHTLAVASGPEPSSYLLTHWYESYAQGGASTRVCITTPFAAITQAEITLLLDATGWRLRHIYGDHDMGEWDEAASRMIIVAQAAE